MINNFNKINSKRVTELSTGEINYKPFTSLNNIRNDNNNKIKNNKNNNISMVQKHKINNKNNNIRNYSSIKYIKSSLDSGKNIVLYNNINYNNIFYQ